MVSGLAEIASVGQIPTHTAQPSGHRAESSFGLPRNRAGVDAAITSGITGCPSANRTTRALGRGSLISKLSACGLDSRSVKFLERVDRLTLWRATRDRAVGTVFKKLLPRVLGSDVIGHCRWDALPRDPALHVNWSLRLRFRALSKKAQKQSAMFLLVG